MVRSPQVVHIDVIFGPHGSARLVVVQSRLEAPLVVVNAYDPAPASGSADLRTTPLSMLEPDIGIPADGQGQ